MFQTPENIVALGRCVACDSFWDACCFFPRIPMPGSTTKWVCQFCLKYILAEKILRVAKKNPESELAIEISALYGSLDDAKKRVVQERRPERRHQKLAPAAPLQAVPAAPSVKAATAHETPKPQQKATTQRNVATRSEKLKRPPKASVKVKRGIPCAAGSECTNGGKSTTSTTGYCSRSCRIAVTAPRNKNGIRRLPDRSRF